MSAKIISLLDCYTARLSRKIVSWVFLSLMIIEGVILIPSVHKREQELLEQFRQLSLTKITWIMITNPDASDQEILEEIKQLQTNQMLEPMIGGSLYTKTGELIGSFGETPQLSFSEIKPEVKFSKISSGCYEIVYHRELIGDKYTIIIRYNLAEIQQQLIAYIIRILILVVIIAIVITAATMIVLGKFVIIPILRLRDDLMIAGEALSQDNNNFNSADFYSFNPNSKDELAEVMKAFSEMFNRVSHEIKQRKNVEEKLRTEKEQSEKLLLNILPESIAERLKQEETCIADGFAEVTILFADLVGFTALSQTISPEELVNLLNQIFSSFDQLTEQYKLEKIKTIGDAYMVASGLPKPRLDHAHAIAKMALDIQEVITKFNAENSHSLSIRIGINTGSVVAGVIGKKKFIYDLWGDAVNIASRMESHGLPGTIQVTESTYECLKKDYIFEERGLIHVKGKGEMMTYLLMGIKP
jgi:adenylate cyclase